MAELDGGRIAARQLKAAGIDTVFGVVAGPMIEVFAGAQSEGLQVIGCRHEMNAAFMASAWGWVKKKPGVMIAGSGPGMTNCVTPLYVATESAMPLLVLGGSAYANTLGVGGFQETDQVAFAEPGSKWTGRVDRTERIGEWVHLALAQAKDGRPGGVYLDFPGHLVSNRVAEEEAPIRARSPEIAAAHADPNAIDRVADMLATAERPLVVVGKGAAWADAGPALEALVARGIPYVTSPMARGTLPDDRAEFVNAARSTALREADAILVVGARFNWIFGFGRPPRYAVDARIAQIDLSAEEITSAADVELGIVADARLAVDALNEALDGRTLASAGGAWLSTLAEQREQNEAKLGALLEDDSVPIHPYRLVREVRDAIPRDAAISVDGETIMGICRAVLPSYTPRACFNAGTTGCMGTGLPYAVGAALADPSRPSVAVLGDYAFGAAAMAVETAARVGAKPVIVVANNEGIAGHMLQDHMLPPGSPPIAALLPAHYEKMGELVDAATWRVDRPEEIRPALDAALAADRLALVHVRIDPKATRASGANYLQ